MSSNIPSSNSKIRWVSSITKPSLTPSVKVFNMLENRKNKAYIDSTRLMLKERRKNSEWSSKTPKFNNLEIISYNHLFQSINPNKEYGLDYSTGNLRLFLTTLERFLLEFRQQDTKYEPSKPWLSLWLKL